MCAHLLRLERKHRARLVKNYRYIYYMIETVPAQPILFAHTLLSREVPLPMTVARLSMIHFCDESRRVMNERSRMRLMSFTD